MAANYQVERVRMDCRVSISGALTAIMVPELKEAIKRELQQDTRELVFDLRETTMLDSSGIGLLIATGNSLAARGAAIRVINPLPEILELLNHMRLVSRLNVRSTAVAQ